jgi:hypothetical protein
MAKNFAEIMIKLGLDSKGFDKEIKQTKSSLGDLGKDMLKFGAAVGGVAAGIGIAGKAIYEVGKRGAIVTQTADSFEYLSEKLKLQPDLLDELRKASRGTVDDMTLMSSTATLLAGTSDELGRALGNATPELLEIAKAANKLNPSLGDTAHMYESIALGIKRASPMILDNLGLTIKIGDANEVMAKKLGKSVDALTAEEKQMALLNATLEAGGNLIDQVGGNVDSATDDFARMETNIQNLKDTFMKGLAPAISEATSRLDEFMTKQFEGAELQKYTTQLMEEKIITDKQALVATMNLAKGIWDLDDAMEYLSQYVPDVTDKEKELEEQLWRTGDATEQQETKFRHLIELFPWYAEETDIATEATDNWSLAMAGAKGALEGLSGTLDGLYQNALKAATNSVYELERMKLVLKLQTEELTQAEIEHALNMLDSIDRMERLTTAVKNGEVSQRQFRLALADGIITQDEYNEMLGITKTSTGNLSTATGIFAGQLGTAAQRAYELEMQLEGLDGKNFSSSYTIDVYWQEHGSQPKPPSGSTPSPDDSGSGGTTPTPSIPDSGDDDPYGYQWQHGGSFVVPPGFPGDSFPMLVSSGERVTVQRKDEWQRNGGGTGTVNNLNIYTNAEVTPDVPDLLLLRAWSNG